MGAAGANPRQQSQHSQQTKQIFITGGVVSSLGKGITAASLGNLLRARGVKVVMQKLDPYINVDPGTMNPFQHGEVFVTEDGAETDLDIGHYERFLGVNLTKDANSTTGKVYQEVLRRERAGEYLGECVQVIPHITNEIIARMRAQAGTPETETGASETGAAETETSANAQAVPANVVASASASSAPDVIITEIGGTVGDIESQPFLEAARQVRHLIGRENCMFIHVSLVPYLAAAGEQKTKPTQHSVAALRSLGIQPDAIVLRSATGLGAGIKKKIALMCDIDEAAVISCPNADSIYEVPSVLRTEGLDSYAVERLGLRTQEFVWEKWEKLLAAIAQAEHREPLEVALVGKYTDLHDAYLSVVEALHAAGFAHGRRVRVRWVESASCTTPEGARQALAGVQAAVIPGGFGDRGIEGIIGALQFLRENQIPALGICLGLQCMVVEAARNLAGLEGANSTEFAPATPHPVVATMAEQARFIGGEGDLGGTMRLGAFPAVLAEGSLAAELYGTREVSERHRHRYEVNSAYREKLEAAGLHISGTSPDNSLVEFVELPRQIHPYYVGTQAHPEFKSRPDAPHPLFTGLIAAGLERAAAAR
ncbi:CTP synthase [Actinobaculum suis]|uniref:CTP synthase n=1 Tax=Actinobaculum suis TaxID=1657 RepID=A0AAW9HT72_9ACTO|nr:CTP synthase [Actinobaculum suis]MDY5153570.1 CTP synthase [Actinobaculum suis]